MVVFERRKTSPSTQKIAETKPAGKSPEHKEIFYSTGWSYVNI